MQTYLNLEVSEGEPIRSPHYEYQADTMQVPCGQYSILWALAEKQVTAAEAIMYLALNHGSSWNTGMTWCFSSRGISKKMGSKMSTRYVRSILKRLIAKGWILPIGDGNAPRRYRLVHHLCDKMDVPIDRDGKPLKFAVPRGDGGPFDRLYAKDITWKACLLWIVNKLNSDWETGETYPCTMLKQAKRCRLGHSTIVPLVQELIDADMLHRLSKPHEKSVFQLFPMPHPQLEKREKREKQPAVRKEQGVSTDGAYWISNNWQYRQHRITSIIERRRDRKWREVTDREWSQIPKAIKEDFDKATYADVLKLRRMEQQAVHTLHSS